MEFQTIVGLLVRHGLTILGGFLVQRGVVDASDVDTLAGGGAIIVGIILSVFNKREAKVTTEVQQ